jgi:hypothetical protein
MVPGEDGVHQLGEDRVLVAQDSGKERLVALEAREEVGAELVADPTPPKRGLGPGGLTELA